MNKGGDRNIEMNNSGEILRWIKVKTETLIWIKVEIELNKSGDRKIEMLRGRDTLLTTITFQEIS